MENKAHDYILDPDDNIIFLVIDIQEKLFQIMKKNHQRLLEHNWQMLIQLANSIKKPVLFSQQYSKGLGETIASIKNLIQDKEHIEKTDFSVCYVGNFKLPSSDSKPRIITGGIETHICVYQTVIDLLRENYPVTVIEDGCLSRNKNDYLRAIKNMKDAGAQIATAEMVAMQLVKKAGTDIFKMTSQFLKNRPAD